MSFDWLLNKMAEGDKEVETDLPTGGDFVRGFAGEWICRPMYRLYAPAEIQLEEQEFKFDAKIMTKNQTGAWYYWYQAAGRLENAAAAAKSLEQRSANRVWRWEMMTSTMLNYSGDDAAEKFGEVIAIDLPLVGLGSTARTEFQLMFLPSMVQAIAVAGGAIPEIIFNYDNLIYDANSVTPEYCEQMVGKVEGKDTKYQDGELWNARTAIWAALGEPEPSRWTSAKDPRTDTASEKLAVPLSLLNVSGISLYARISRIAAPRMPTQKEKDAERMPFGMNVVSQMWTNKAAAVKELGGEEGEYPPIPAEWAGTSVGQFREWVVKFLKDNYDNQPKVVVLKAIAKRKDLESTLALTAEELVPWIEYVLK